MLKLVPRGWAAVASGLIFASIVLLALEENVGAFATFGLGAVILVGLAFFAVGRSEDLDRQKRPHG
jgi:membrane protease YdiL (CAAX protease family)